MRQITTDIEIKASAAQIWSILTDLPAYAHWNPLIQRASGTVETGGQLELFIAAPGLANRSVRVQLLQVDPGRELRWRGRLLVPHLLDGDHSFLIEPLGAGRVRVTQKERFSGLLVRLVAPWLMPNMTAGFEAMNRALKRAAEEA